MSVVILTAVLSCLNSRLLCDLARAVYARRAQRRPALAGAPQCAARTRALGADRCGRGPARHSGRATKSPGGVFAFLVNASGALIVFVYLITALAQIRLRRGRDARTLPVRMWWFPWASYAAVAGMLAVLVAMALTRALASQFYVSLGALALALLAYALHRAVSAAQGRGRATPEARRHQAMRPVLPGTDSAWRWRMRAASISMRPAQR